MGFEVKEIQPTPNPNAMKFVVNGLDSKASVSFLNSEAAAGHPLGSKLFTVPGVTSVLLCDDFVTINKSPQAKWPDVKAKVRKVLAEA